MNDDSPCTQAAPSLLDGLTEIAVQAGVAIMALKSPKIDVRSKADASPVTPADEAAQAVILAGLHRLMPGWAIVSEESERRPQPGADFVLVDPLDGTKEFIAGRDEFTVNIAVIRDGLPMMGVVGAPARGVLWRGEVGRGAERLDLRPGDRPDQAKPIAIHTRRAPEAGLTVAVSRSHLDVKTLEFLAKLQVAEHITAGSALKFCEVAEGHADLYPRLGPTSEWDLAAGHAVLAAAGGIVTTPDGAPLTYGHAAEGFRVAGFLAWGDAAASAQINK